MTGALAKHHVAPLREGARAGYRPAGTYWVWSDDFGLTWPLENARLVAAEAQACAPPIRMANGTILLAAYGRTSAMPACSSLANRSVDGGLSWTLPRDTGIVSGACPRLLKVADGRIVLTFRRRQKPFGVRAMLSSDGGESWGDTAWLLRVTPNGNQGYTSSLQFADGTLFTAGYAENDAGVTGIVGTFWRLP